MFDNKTAGAIVGLIYALFLAGGALANAAPKDTPPIAEQPAQAETEGSAGKSSNDLGLGLALGYYQVRDHTLQNPHLHQGPLFGLLVDYERNDGPLRSAVSFNLGYASLSDSYGLSAFNAVTGFRVEMSRLVSKLGAGQTWSLYAGAFIRDNSDFGMYPFIDESHLYWITSISAGPVVSLERDVWDGGAARFTLRLPVAAMVSRPPEERLYNNDKDKIDYVFSKIYESMKFKTLDKHFALDGEAALRFKMTQGWGETLGYRLNYVRDSSPAQTQILSHSLFVRISRQW